MIYNLYLFNSILLMKKQFPFIALGIILLFNSCSKNKEKSSEVATFQYIQDKKADTLKEKNYIAIFDGKTNRTSTLSQQELKIVNKNLIKAVDEYNVLLKAKLEKSKKKDPSSTLTYEEEKLNLRNYYRQYFVSTDKSGDKTVFIFCFCYYTGDLWRTERIQVFDGGSCYFTVEINITKSSYSKLQTHGLA